MDEVFKVLDVKWMPYFNLEKLKCPRCGNEFWHRVDRWWAYCKCGLKTWSEGKPPLDIIRSRDDLH